jgi:four helix bundle protein
MSEFVPLEKFDVYQMARELSKLAWEIYEPMDWQTRKIIGDQFITSVDSVAANFAEGFGRYHYLDKIKFCYNSRGSLYEANNWVELMLERKQISKEQHEKFKTISQPLGIKLNNYIAAEYKAKARE